jgi:hypothetical protein
VTGDAAHRAPRRRRSGDLEHSVKRQKRRERHRRDRQAAERAERKERERCAAANEAASKRSEGFTRTKPTGWRKAGREMIVTGSATGAARRDIWREGVQATGLQNMDRPGWKQKDDGRWVRDRARNKGGRPRTGSADPEQATRELLNRCPGRTLEELRNALGRGRKPDHVKAVAAQLASEIHETRAQELYTPDGACRSPRLQPVVIQPFARE